MMKQIKINKIAKRLAMMAILLIGLYLTVVDQAMAQRTNLALGKKASQSSDIGTPFRVGEGTADLAVDGNTDGDWSKGSVTSTACNIDSTNECQGSNQPYWRVDLGAVYDIDLIKIWNRTDCCQKRLSNFHLRVTSDLKGDDNTSYAGLWYRGENPMIFTPRERGRYVTIQVLDNNAFVSLAEVQVFGSLANVAEQTVKTVEDQYWDNVIKRGITEDFKSYLREYPNGKYSEIARLKINQSNTGNSSNVSFLSFKSPGPNLSNMEFMKSWEDHTKTQLPIKYGNDEIYRASAPSKNENFFYLEVHTPDPTKHKINSRAILLETILYSDYCKSEAYQRKVKVVISYSMDAESFSSLLGPGGCPANQTSKTLFKRNIYLSNSVTNRYFIAFWVSTLKSELPLREGMLEIYRTDTSRSIIENILMFNVRGTNYYSRENISELSPVFSSYFQNDYCKSEAFERKIKIIFLFDGIEDYTMPSLDPYDCDLLKLTTK